MGGAPVSLHESWCFYTSEWCMHGACMDHSAHHPSTHRLLNSQHHKNVTAHLFEYTTSFLLDPDLHFKFPDKGIVLTQMTFCLKEKNQQKITAVLKT